MLQLILLIGACVCLVAYLVRRKARLRSDD
jgi:hypothetical protein